MIVENIESRYYKVKLADRPVIVGIVLPRLGGHNFECISDEGVRAHYRYDFQVHKNAPPVEVHVHGRDPLIREWSEMQTIASFEIELFMHSTEEGKELLAVNLYEADQSKKWTHSCVIMSSPKEPSEYFITRPDMQSIGILIQPLLINDGPGRR